MFEKPFDSEEFVDPEEGYWDEEQWEAFFQEQEAILDDYAEWFDDWIEDAGGEGYPDRGHEEDFCNRWCEDYDTSAYEETGEPDEEEMYLLDFDFEQKKAEDELDQLDAIPAWKAAYHFAIAAHDFIELFCGDQGVGPDEDVRKLCCNCYMIAAHIASGHSLGYDDPVICGNIAKCKRALACAEECIEALTNLSEGKEEAKTLIVRAKVVRSFIWRRISDLRENVWW